MIEKLKIFYKKYNYILLGVLLGLIIFIIFSPALDYGFINFDDNILVYENEEITNLDFKTVKRFFSKPYHSLYHPFVYISFALDYALTDSMNPHVFHAVNFLLHIFISLLVMFLIYLLSSDILIAFVCALLFAVHPMHVEPVVWISERKELLCAFFYFFSLIFYVLYKTKDRNKKTFYILAVLMFLCALLSKVMAVTLPLVLVLYDYVFIKNVSGKTQNEVFVGASGKLKYFKKKFCRLNAAFKDKIIFFVLAAAFTVIGFFAAVPSVDGAFIADIFKNVYRGAFQYSFYIMKFFLPLKLSIIYPAAMEQKILFMVLTQLFILFWIYINYTAFKKSKKIFFGLMFFTITVLPVLNLVPFGLEIPADRFTYIPYMGLIYSLIILVSRIKPSYVKKAFYILLSIFICGAIFLSRIRVGEWEDNITLFSKSIERYPTYVAYTNRGAAYIDTGQYDLAAADELSALKIGSSYEAIAHMLLSYVYKLTGKYDEALKEINIALETASDDDAENAYFARAELYKILRQPDKAIADLHYLYDYYDDTSYAIWMAADIYEKEGKLHLAAYEMDILLETEPNNKDAEAYKKRMYSEMLNSNYPIPEEEI